ncbi:MAG: acetate--CoA ligase family protein [Desulfobacteraceae bacterium]|nr:acetate--CoA ligase family protein [Desulfobacteraceae bacterium]
MVPAPHFQISPGALNENQAKQLLNSYGIPTVDETVAADADQAVIAAEAFGYPVVLKGMGAALQHKTEKGLVHLHLHDAAAVRRAAVRIGEAAGKDLEGLLVQPQISGQREFMAGLFRDPQFGPVILFGLGGTLTEALGDITMRLAPLTAFDMRQMIGEIRAQKLLGPFRGEAAVDQHSLIQVLQGLSRLALAHPEVAEIDVNPLRVTPQGKIVAVDALVMIQPPPAPRQSTPPVPPKEIGKLFHPRAVAFVGASAQMGKWGNMLPANTISGGFEGKIFLVNAHGGEILGQPTFRQLTDIPDKIDLAVVTVPADKVIDLIPQCQAKGIHYMVLITSGFAEVGTEGQALEARLIEAARQAGILILGPNTMGINNPHIHLYSTGASVTPIAGSTVMVAQSGNMGGQLLGFAEQQGIGMRGFSGSGNEAMITMADYLEGFEIDEVTRTVLVYAEGFKNGRRFFEAARRVSRKKPIVLLKGGQTQAGQKAAASHSGAMTSDVRVFEALCRQTGIVHVRRPMDLLDLAAAFDSLPLPRGPRVAIMTFGGGWGVVATDLCQVQGLELPELDAEIVRTIDGVLPPYWSHANPVDLVGHPEPDSTFKILETLMRWEGCDAVINLGIMGRRAFVNRLLSAVGKCDPKMNGNTAELYHQVVDQFEHQFLTRSLELMTELGKPIIGVSLRADTDFKTVISLPGQKYKGVFYQTPERAALALAKMVGYQRFLREQEK